MRLTYNASFKQLLHMNDNEKQLCMFKFIVNCWLFNFTVIMYYIIIIQKYFDIYNHYYLQCNNLYFTNG